MKRINDYEVLRECMYGTTYIPIKIGIKSDFIVIKRNIDVIVYICAYITIIIVFIINKLTTHIEKMFLNENQK